MARWNMIKMVGLGLLLVIALALPSVLPKDSVTVKGPAGHLQITVAV